MKNNKLTDVYIFTAFVFAILGLVGWLGNRGVNIPLSTVPIFTGILGFIFWRFIHKKPITEIYSKGYPYRKLKAWAVVSAIFLFEYVLVWGLNSEQIKLADQHLYAIIVIFVGAIAFYFSFVRMRVSLRFLFLGIFIPILASGVAVGLGKYFGFVQFSMPESAPVERAVLFNTCYWILFGIFYHLVCEEPAFRGFLFQRLLNKGRTKAVLISSVIYACWRVLTEVFYGTNVAQGLVSFAEHFIVGCLLAMLFVKGKNLLIAATSHGIISGLKLSLLAGKRYPGLSQYFQMTTTSAEVKFIILWFGCLFVGLVLVLLTAQKKSSASSIVDKPRAYKLGRF